MAVNHIIRVVQITQTLEIGGLETLIVELCKNMNPQKFHVQVLCLNGYDEQYKKFLDDHGIALTLIQKIIALPVFFPRWRLF